MGRLSVLEGGPSPSQGAGGWRDPEPRPAWGEGGQGPEPTSQACASCCTRFHTSGYPVLVPRLPGLKSDFLRLTSEEWSRLLSRGYGSSQRQRPHTWAQEDGPSEQLAYTTSS